MEDEILLYLNLSDIKDIVQTDLWVLLEMISIIRIPKLYASLLLFGMPVLAYSGAT